MAVFEEGKSYESGDAGISPIKIIKRTPKTCVVENDEGHKWRMRIKVVDGNEVMTDSKVPKNWQGVFTYSAKFRVKEG